MSDKVVLAYSYFIFPALQANALYEGQYPLATAKKIIEGSKGEG